jgi:RimJ/RimL family protein N-acetyltransferase
MSAPMLKTKRLILRQWKEADLLPFFKINSDPLVTEFLSVLTELESNELAEKIKKELSENPYGFWAVEIPNSLPFIGFVGLHLTTFTSFFTPCIEIGWRLDHRFWNQGFATEAATCCLDYAFIDLDLKEIVSFTSHKNNRSIRIMEKLYMTSSPKENFIHPKIPKKHPLQPFVLYRLTQSNWLDLRKIEMKTKNHFYS